MNTSFIPRLERSSSTPIVFVESSYITIYDFEKNYDVPGWYVWISRNWTTSIYVSAFYFACIYLLQNWMRDRKPFRLTRTLFTWNTFLAIFSFIVFLRTSPEFFRVVLTKNGLHNSICNWTEPHNYATAFWGAQFIISKVYELFDTAFIILRKRKLIFLHCYHHAMTLMMACILSVLYEPHQLWYIVMNSFVHSIMYSYYALRAAGIKVPPYCAMTVTAIQILQLILGLLVNAYGILVWSTGEWSDCPRSRFGLQICFAVAFSYLVLFVHFFYKTYIVQNKLTSYLANGNKKSEECKSLNVDATKKKKVN